MEIVARFSKLFLLLILLCSLSIILYWACKVIDWIIFFFQSPEKRTREAFEDGSPDPPQFPWSQLIGSLLEALPYLLSLLEI